MNRKLLIVLCVIIAAVACRKDKSGIVPATASAANQNTKLNPHSAAKFTDDSIVSSLFITKTDANTMISSYLFSIGSSTLTASGVNDLKSFHIDADSLRAYLADPKIKNIKLCFGHTMGYIAAGHAGQYSGMQSGALTIIIAGYDSAGNYVYFNQNEVLDHAIPCPYSCGSGQAGEDLLQ